MANKLTDRDLCIALSDLFLDTETNYQYVVSIAKNFDLQHVEDVLLDWLAPVLHWAYYSVAPEWAGYDENWLWDEIQKVIVKNNNARFFKRKILNIRRIYMKRLLKDPWQRLLEEGGFKDEVQHG